MILSLIRKRTDATTDEKFAVNEIYPIDSVKQPEELISLEKFVERRLKYYFICWIYRLIELLNTATQNESVKKILNPLLRMIIGFFWNFIFYRIWILAFGSAVLDECLLKAGLSNESCILGKNI